MKKDHSKEIYEKYFGNDKVVRITLKNKKVLEGSLIGFFHGNAEAGESFITRWHFLGRDEAVNPAVTMEGGQAGRMIEQRDIDMVELI